MIYTYIPFPEINITPENWFNEYFPFYYFLLGSPIFRGYVGFGECIYALSPRCSGRNLSALPTQLTFHLNGVVREAGWSNRKQSEAWNRPGPKRMGLKNVRNSNWRTWNKIPILGWFFQCKKGVKLSFWRKDICKIHRQTRGYRKPTKLTRLLKGHEWKYIYLWLNSMGWHQLDVRRTYPDLNTWAWQGPHSWRSILSSIQFEVFATSRD